MTKQTKELVNKWIEMHHGNVERLAKYMRDTLGIGGIKACRALIEEATSGSNQGETK